jgi:hypothetical protein
MIRKILFIFTFVGLFTTLSSPAMAQIYVPKGKFLLTDPTKLDISHSERQRTLIDDLARRYLGTPIRGDKTSDIRTLQRLIDQNIVDTNDTATMQAMGVVLGDLLAREMKLDWVIFEDVQGRNRALRYKQLETVLFPITMLSRRLEAGIKVDIQAVFDKAVESYSPLLPKLPYS